MSKTISVGDQLVVNLMVGQVLLMFSRTLSTSGPCVHIIKKVIYEPPPYILEVLYLVERKFCFINKTAYM